MESSFLPLYRDKKHKFKNGYWKWNENETKLKFIAHEPEMMISKRTEAVMLKASKPPTSTCKTKEKKKDFQNENFLRFVNEIDENEEQVFLKFFQRPRGFYDSDVITIQDVKNISLFTLTTTVAVEFIEFLYTEVFDKFLHAILVYMDQFLKTIEFLLIRRDELNEFKKIRDNYSLDIEKFLSKQLDDRRLLISREYSKVNKESFTYDVHN